MDILYKLHSHNRWLILLIGGLAIVKYLIGWLAKSDFGKIDKAIGQLFVIIVTINALIGFYNTWVFFTGGAFTHKTAEHLTTMLIALGLCHFAAKWKNAEPSIRFRNTMLAYLGTLLLIVLGIVRLRGGLTW